ncbi:hypothetical protein [Histophilus somni]|uniref:hypothetical protein n=1 Tax=Histophilus somni TaxID=731 RepID=UPI001E639FED|nr:hypothetical protein [Histophilus somni]
MKGRTQFIDIYSAVSLSHQYNRLTTLSEYILFLSITLVRRNQISGHLNLLYSLNNLNMNRYIIMQTSIPMEDLADIEVIYPTDDEHSI